MTSSPEIDEDIRVTIKAAVIQTAIHAALIVGFFVVLIKMGGARVEQLRQLGADLSPAALVVLNLLFLSLNRLHLLLPSLVILLVGDGVVFATLRRSAGLPAARIWTTAAALLLVLIGGSMLAALYLPL